MVWTVDSSTVKTDSTVSTTDGFAASVLAGAASDAVSAAASLINFASVTLAGTLYTGIGGIFDPNLVWPFSTPVVGSVVYYDPTFITVLPNGEINSTSNNCAAEIQFNDGTNVNVVSIFVTPLMVAYATDASSAQGSLISSGAALAGAAITLATAAANLTTGIPLVGAGSDSSTAAGALSTGIPLVGAANDLSSAAAALITAIQLAAAASDTSGGSATLSTGIQLAGAGSDTTSAGGSLSTQILMASAASNVSSALAALSTQIMLAVQAVDTTSGQASLTTQVQLAGAASDTSSGQAVLGSLIALMGGANDLTSAAGSLLSLISVSAAAFTATAAGGSLSTSIRPAGFARTSVIAAASLGTSKVIKWPNRVIVTSFYSNSLLGTAGPLPYGEFFARVGDVEIYAIDWDGWLANYWERGGIVPAGQVIRPTNPNGYAMSTVLGGQSGNAEPLWGTPSLGQTFNDGSVVWAIVPIDNTSLYTTLQSAGWTAPQGILATNQQQTGQMTIVTLDASNAVAGTNYPVNVAATMADGEIKVGQIVLKVR